MLKSHFVARGLVLGLAFLLGSQLESPVSAQSQRVRPEIPSQLELQKFGLTRSWWGQATMDASRAVVQHLVADEDTVFVQSSGGIMTAFDAETGRKLWAIQLGMGGSASYPAVANLDVVLVSSGTVLYALERRTGNLRWQLDLPKSPSTSPAVDEDRVYIGSLDGSVLAFNLRRVRELYQDNLLPQWSYSSLDWRYQTGAEVLTPPVSNGRVVAFASQDASLYSVFGFNRKLNFQFETNRPAAAPMTYSRGRLILPTTDFQMHSIDIDNGKVYWTFVSGLPVDQKPRVIDDQVFILPQRDGLYALSIENGERIWSNKRVSEFVAATPQLVYASDEFGNLLILSREDGAILAALPFRFFDVRFANDRTDRIFMTTESGLVMALREEEIEFPLYHMYPDRRPLLPEFMPEGVTDPPGPAEEKPADDDNQGTTKNPFNF